jgi:hypothetical protein
MVPYAWGDDNSSECPANFLRIRTEDGCRAAAFAKRKYFAGFANISARPAGCYGSVAPRSISVFLNLAPVGAGFPNRPLLCAGAPIAHLVSVMPCPCMRSSNADPEGGTRENAKVLWSQQGPPTRACHLCALALPRLHPSLAH